LEGSGNIDRVVQMTDELKAWQCHCCFKYIF